MKIGRKEIFVGGMNVGEIAAAAAGNTDLLTDAVVVFDYEDRPPSFAGFYGAHKPGRTGAYDDDIFINVMLVLHVASFYVYFKMW